MTLKKKKKKKIQRLGTVNNCSYRSCLQNRPTVLKISKIAKFQSDLLKINEDIVPQSREILQTFVWWRAQIKVAPHHTNVCEIFATSLSYIFARLRRITFKFGKFTNFKALFPVMSTDFP